MLFTSDKRFLTCDPHVSFPYGHIQSIH